MKQDFETYKFRCSQLSKLMVGNIGLTDNQDERIAELIEERDTGVNKNGNKCKWTDAKKKELERLERIKNTPKWDLLPATMKTELRKIHRAEKYNRNFSFSNKYTKKGIEQEEEGITTYDMYMKKMGHNILLMKNGDRLWNNHFQGEPDLRPFIYPYGEFKGLKCGVDIKCPYDLSTFPYPEDALISEYEYQNLGYMDLEECDMWITAYVLVNASENQVQNEKMKWYYEMKNQQGTPDEPDHPFHEEYLEKLREVERAMIYDYDRFVAMYPYHIMEHTREQWMEGDYDIPLEERVLEKIVLRDKFKLDDLKERVQIGREYLLHLDKQK